MIMWEVRRSRVDYRRLFSHVTRNDPSSIVKFMRLIDQNRLDLKSRILRIGILYCLSFPSILHKRLFQTTPNYEESQTLQ